MIEFLDKQDADEKDANAVTGIVHGSSPHTLERLAQYNWKNPITKIVFETMRRSNEEHNSGDDNPMDSKPR